MNETARYLFLAGALPFVFLGTVHALATPLSKGARKGLTPRDPGVIDTMAATHVLLTRRTDLWRAWVGFNLSHSLGAVLFGVFVLVVGRSPASFAGQAALCVPLATVTAAVYLAIGLRYWFRAPNTGIAIALGCFFGSWCLL
jgi:hypothetical protein